MTDTTETLAERLKRFRKRWSMNTTEAGEVLGISKRTIDGLEQGRPTPYERVIRLALTQVERKKEWDAQPEGAKLGTLMDLGRTARQRRKGN